MGIETVVTCDTCNRIISKEDYIAISLHKIIENKWSLNADSEADEETTKTFCLEHGHIAWTEILRISNRVIVT